MKSRIALVGLDGVPIHLLQTMVDNGVMPNLSRWLRSRPMRPLSSSTPPVSSVAWASLYTGKNPGEHGIFGFHDIDAATFRSYFTNLSHVRAHTLWDIAGLRGLRSLIFNVPQTYPAKPIQGTMISGFVAPDLKKAVQPLRLLDYLADRGYRTDPETGNAVRNPEAFMQDLFDVLRVRGEVLLRLMAKEPWDFMMAVITETDRLHHFLWNAGDDPAHLLHEEFFDFYSKLDVLLGQLLARLQPIASTILLSDHGFGTLKKEFYLNRWLEENRYLELKYPGAVQVEDVADASRAFALDPSRIYLRVKGKFPLGPVEPGRRYEELRDEIAGRLSLLKDPETGDAVVREALKKEELYDGPLLDAAPDLIVRTNEGYDPKGAFHRKTLFGHSGLTGMHTADDAFIAMDEDWGEPVPKNVEEVGALLGQKLLSLRSR